MRKRRKKVLELHATADMKTTKTNLNNTIWWYKFNHLNYKILKKRKIIKKHTITPIHIGTLSYTDLQSNSNNNNILFGTHSLLFFYTFRVIWNVRLVVLLFLVAAKLLAEEKKNTCYFIVRNAAIPFLLKGAGKFFVKLKRKP